VRNLVATLAVGGGIGLVAAVVAFTRPMLFERGELWTYDVRARHAARPAEASKEIVIVDVGEGDIDDVDNNLGLTWPWPRALYGYIDRYAAAGGAKAIAFDFVFQDRGAYSINDTEELAAAMRDTKRTIFGLTLTRNQLVSRPAEGKWGAKLADYPSVDDARHAALRLMAWNVRAFVVGKTVYYGAKATAADVTQAWQRISSADEMKDMFLAPGADADAAPIAPTPIELTDEVLADEVRGDTIVAGRDALSLSAPSGVTFEHRPFLDAPLAILAGAATRLGFVHFENDADGIMRRFTVFVEHDGKLYPALALAMWMVGHPDTPPRFDGNELVLGDRRLAIDDEGKFGIRFFRRGPDPYQHVGAYDVLRSQEQLDAHEQPVIPPETFAGKYVIVAPTATALRDLRVTPVARIHDGADVQANALDNMLSGRAIRRLPPWADALIALLLSTVVALATVACWSNVKSVVAALAAIIALTIAAGAGYVAEANRIFAHHGVWIAVVVPSMGMLLSSFGALLVATSLERRDRRFAQHAWGLFTSDELVEMFMRHPELLSPGYGQRSEISVYFSDIAGFTSFSEVLPPERMVRLLNDYLTQMTEIVLAHGGIVDKYIGDAIMAFWGAPIATPDHARLAVKAALAMRRREAELRPKWQAEYGTLLTARAGVNSGSAVVGNMGSKHKIAYTAMGDMVNLASRLEGANKAYGTSLMISESTYARVKDEIEVRELDRLAVKGKAQPVVVYEVLCEAGRLDERTAETRRRYDKALVLYREQKFVEAKDAFRAVHDHDPSDGPSQTYLERCEWFIAHPPGADWDGVWHMKEK
jgi:adenylate cyclase